MDFELIFNGWLSEALVVEPPAAVVAFTFNLFEPATKGAYKFGLELVGASSFDPENSDWACNEVWEPPVRHLLIPQSFSGKQWPECLARVQLLVERRLQSKDSVSQRLRSRRAVAVGFVDGDLHIMWSTASEA